MGLAAAGSLFQKLVRFLLFTLAAPLVAGRTSGEPSDENNKSSV
jgi:hypothetical protein